MDIWRLPEIMIIHLKRFHYEAGHAEKIDDLIEFPIYAFDTN
jgi:ubiquitin C-terminal hydrolase